MRMSSNLLSIASLAFVLSVVLLTRERRRWGLNSSINLHRMNSVSSRCPTESNLHYVGSDSQIHSDYSNHHSIWYDRESTRFSFNSPKEGFLTTLRDGTFVLRTISMKGEVEMSAYNDDMVLEKTVKGAGPFRWKYLPPESTDFDRPVEVLEGDYVAFIGPFPGNFAHFILDHMPFMGYLRNTFSPKTKFIFADYQIKNRNRMEELDPVFNERIEWVQCHNIEMRRFEFNRSFQIRNGSLTVVTGNIFLRNLKFNQLARSWVFNRYKTHPMPLKTIIYYTRNSKNAFHSRKMDLQHEHQIIQRIQLAMKRHHRPERLVIFKGTEAFNQQIALFRSATAVIGPHGGGLANLIWTLPVYECDERPKVLEFLAGPETPDVYPGLHNYSKTYHRLLSTCPWIEYHHILFVPPSTWESLYVDLEDLDHALDVILR